MSRTTLRVFEHETVRVAPGSRTIDGALVPEHLDLNALARFNDANEQRYFRMGWQSVTFREYVGYLQVGDIAFEILPKADRGHAPGSSGRWKRALLEMLEVATGVKLHTPTDAHQTFERSTLLDLLAAAFLKEVSDLLREGLARAYRTHESNGTTFRGRLLVSENIRENLVRPDRFFVRYATFDADTLINRVIGEALRVVADLPIAPTLRARAAEHGVHFEDLTPERIVAGTFDRITVGRATIRYEKALILARALLEEVGPALKHGQTSVFALLFDMNFLWETYVAALFRRACPRDLVVRTQERHLFWRSGNRLKKRVRPDIVVRDRTTNAVALVADTKWKLLGDRDGPSDDDLKQMFVYNELLRSRDAVLLYPSRTRTTTTMRGVFAVAVPHGCRTAALGLFEGEELQTDTMTAQVASMLDELRQPRLPEGPPNANP